MLWEQIIDMINLIGGKHSKCKLRLLIHLLEVGEEGGRDPADGIRGRVRA